MRQICRRDTNVGPWSRSWSPRSAVADQAARSGVRYDRVLLFPVRRSSGAGYLGNWLARRVDGAVCPSNRSCVQEISSGTRGEFAATSERWSSLG